MKRGIVFATGAGTLASAASGSVAGASGSELQQRGPARTKADGVFTDDVVEAELGVSGPKTAQGDTIPIGIVWACSLPRADMSWHEVRNMEITFEPNNNPTKGKIWSHTPYGSAESRGTFGRVLESLTSLGWMIAPVANIFSIMPDEDGSIDSSYYGNGKSLSVKWPSLKQATTNAPSGGIRLAPRLSSGDDPQKGRYTFTVKMTGDVWYVSNSNGESKVDEFSVNQPISIDYTN